MITIQYNDIRPVYYTISKNTDSNLWCKININAYRYIIEVSNKIFDDNNISIGLEIVGNCINHIEDNN